MLRELRSAILFTLVLTVLTGLAYPLAVTGVAQMLFPRQAHGSLIERDGRLVGSELIGQAFDDPKYFWGRLSATAPTPCNAAASGGSNFGPMNPGLVESAKARIDALRAADPENQQPIPIDLVTASGSGLDPDISPAAARWQVGRVAKARGLSPEAVRNLVSRHTRERTLGLLGEPRVNVLALNLALDAGWPRR